MTLCAPPTRPLPFGMGGGYVPPSPPLGPGRNDDDRDGDNPDAAPGDARWWALLLIGVLAGLAWYSGLLSR